MKRLILSLLVLTGISASLTSCEKCTVCTASTIDGDIVTEWCGNELDVREFEDFFTDSLAALAVPIAGYCERGPGK